MVADKQLTVCTWVTRKCAGVGTTRGSRFLALSLTHQTVLTSLGQEKDEEGEEDPSQVKTSIAHIGSQVSGDASLVSRLHVACLMPWVILIGSLSSKYLLLSCGVDDCVTAPLAEVVPTSQFPPTPSTTGVLRHLTAWKL